MLLGTEWKRINAGLLEQILLMLATHSIRLEGFRTMETILSSVLD